MRQKAAKDRSNLHQPDATSLRFVASGKPQASIFANRLAVPCREFFALRLDSEGPITEASGIHLREPLGGAVQRVFCAAA